jgi:hypothetical protein
MILVFEKIANFFAENCRNSQKIFIITSTPGPTVSEKKISNFFPLPLKWSREEQNKRKHAGELSGHQDKKIWR